MSIQSERFSSLLDKHTLITIELQRLQALLVYYSDIGSSAKVSQAADAIKRLEVSKKTIAIELDRRMTNGTNSNNGTTEQEDSTGSPA